MDRQTSWRNPRVLLTLFLIFLCGSLTGALTVRYGFRPKPQPLTVYWAQGGKQVALEHFEQELNLSPAQSKKMELVLDDFVTYYHTLQAQMDEVRANGKSRILDVLNPEQQKKFEKMLTDAQSKHPQ